MTSRSFYASVVCAFGIGILSFGPIQAEGVNATIDSVAFVWTFGGGTDRTKIKVAGTGAPGYAVRTTIWDHVYGNHSGPVTNNVAGGQYANEISYVLGGDYPDGSYEAGSVLEGNPLPEGQNVAVKGFLIQNGVLVVLGGGGGSGD